jgi:hypothetical protein
MVPARSGEVDQHNGGTDAVVMDDPERARLSEYVGVVV